MIVVSQSCDSLGSWFTEGCGLQRIVVPQNLGSTRLWFNKIWVPQDCGFTGLWFHRIGCSSSRSWSGFRSCLTQTLDKTVPLFPNINRIWGYFEWRLHVSKALFFNSNGNRYGLGLSNELLFIIIAQGATKIWPFKARDLKKILPERYWKSFYLISFAASWAIYYDEL